LLDNVLDVWTKDYSPIQVGPRKFAQFRYEPNYLKESPDLRTGRDVAEQFIDLGECEHSEINLDGGNVVASRNKAILTDKIYRENPTWERSKLRDELRRILQVDQIVVIPGEPWEPIGHADGLVRFVNDNTVLASDYSNVNADFGKRLIKALSRHGLSIELVPYFSEESYTDGIQSAVGCYVNFLYTEKVVIVPAFGCEQDYTAFSRLKALILDVPVVSLECKNLARAGGIYNCVSSGFRSATQNLDH
jgi:agmatine deiminase